MRQLIFLESTQGYASKIMKRLFDILFSLIALLVFLIPMVVISILLKFKEKHPLLFKQVRIGINKKSFEILKFQTLINETPTTTGKILRKTGLDELPQFINVLKGDMSIVGPRALTKSDIERFAWDNAFHAKRWTIKPGITGLAQLYGGQHKKTSWFWDAKYLDKNNILLDLVIVLLSFLVNMMGKKRVRRIIWPDKLLN